MRLLLIEDDPEIGQLLLRYLSKQGFAVTHVTDGATGVDAFVAASRSPTPFHVVLTDGLLPRKNGYEVAKAIRASGGGDSVGIAMISAAFRGSSARAHASQSGIDAYFAKPFVLVELREKLFQLAQKGGATLPPQASLTTPRPMAAVPRTGPGLGTTSPSRPASTSTSTSTSTSPARPASTPPVEAKTTASTAASTTASSGADARSSSSTSSEGASLTDSPRNKPLSVVGHHELLAPVSVGRLLANASRERLSGIIVFRAAESWLEVALLGGVVVGANDNLREHILGEWLHRQGRITDAQLSALNTRLAGHQERVAEALVALDIVRPTEALALCERQARHRLRRALLWEGTAEARVDEERASLLAAGAIDLVETMLAFGLEDGERRHALRLIDEQGGAVPERTADFDAGLVSFARLRPNSLLPMRLLGGASTITALVIDDPQLVQELYALWLAGLVRLPGEPADHRAIARAVAVQRSTVFRGAFRSAATDELATDTSTASTSTETAPSTSSPSPAPSDGDLDAAWDALPVPTTAPASKGMAALSDEIHRLVLKARGQSLYALLELPADTPSAQVLDALQSLERRVGRDACDGVDLGPSSDVARELWTILAEGTFIFGDPQLRAAYDEATQRDEAASTSAGAPQVSTDRGPVSATSTSIATTGTTPIPLGEVIARATADLNAGRLVEASALLAAQRAHHADDAELEALAGYLDIRQGERDRGIRGLMLASRTHPQATKPLFYLSQVARDDGDLDRARALLQECARRAPDDIDVALALQTLV